MTTHVERHKYAGIMAEIAHLESELEALEESIAAAGHGGHDSSSDKLNRIRDRLAERMRELARISNACKKIHLSR